MRYQHWDILLFPNPEDQSKVPLQEFKTACSVIQDQEQHTYQTSPHLLPIVTSFIPALEPNTPFRVSIHCWQNPDFSRYIQAIKKPSDTMMFEARLFIDGEITGSRWFHQNGPWPSVIEMSVNVDKYGEFDTLRFPSFHRELLAQNFWHAGDDLGRIKLVISEGFERHHQTEPFERIKNIAAFSFQHAPLDVLEQSSIAWPNQAMWRQVSLVGQYIAQQSVSPRKISGEDELHSHSPCRGIAPARSFGTKSLSGMLAPVMPKASSSSDPFTDKVNLAFQGWRRTSINDISMPDYSSSGSGYTRYPSRQVTDPMSVTGFESAAVSYSHADSYNETVGPRPPANTPQNESTARTQHTTAIDHTHTRKSISRKNTMSQAAEEIMPLSDIVTGGPDQAFAPGTVVVHQRPNANDSIKGRKENITHSPASARYGSDGANEHFNVISEAFSTAANVNNKRQRVVTPAASKAIDDEDEPRSSPTARKVSRTNAKEAQTQTQKRALRNITNNI